MFNWILNIPLNTSQYILTYHSYPIRSQCTNMVFLCFQGVEKGCIGNKWVVSKFFVKLVVKLSQNKSFKLFFILGEAITILSSKEMFHFKRMCKEIGTKATKMKVSRDMLDPYVENYETLLQKLQDKIIEEKRDKSFVKRKWRERNLFLIPYTA